MRIISNSANPIGPCLATCLVIAGQFLATTAAEAEDGHRLWLGYDPLPAEQAAVYRQFISTVVVSGDSPTLEVARRELIEGCSGLLGVSIPAADKVAQDGVLVVGNPETSSLIAGLGWAKALARLGPEGCVIRSAELEGHNVTVIASDGEAGTLYGVFHFLRMLQTGESISALDISSSPRFKLRLLNHWDNLNGTIERGYAGRSLWNWGELPDTVDGRVREYARANGSIGINGSVLNNVNANAEVLSTGYLPKVAAIADTFRPYGVKVYLSARFSAPMELDGLPTADPLDAEVVAWWKRKADAIYKLIPDFGGFLVKANSEGQPGPRTYERDHVDGANMLAAAVAPHGGVVMWRAFVYDMKEGYDRAGAAYEQLQPFDGRFATNVLLQVKNGPIDFQPREPFHPLFGGMPKTQLMPELQITQEYLGFDNHLAFLAPMWREVLTADTYAEGPDSTVSKVVDGSLYQQQLTGMAGVANTGSDTNWTGHILAQANWYAFGRLAWDPNLTSEQIAREWVQMTFTQDPAAVDTITRLLVESHEAVVDYMTPLGLHHIMWGGHHYGPAPWWDRERRADWNPVYYHRADEAGLGFDRTDSGSGTVSQYHPPVRDRFANLEICPEEYLVWFHHVPWNHQMKSGRTLWEELCLYYQRGVDWVRAARKQWASLEGTIDPERHAAVSAKLEIQERDAVHWRDACLLYFQTFSKQPLPEGVEKPAKTLDEYKSQSLRW